MADGLLRGERSDIPLYGPCPGMAGAVVSQTAASFCSLGKTWGVNLRNQGRTGPLFRLQPQGRKSALPGLPCAQRRLFRCRASSRKLWLGVGPSHQCVASVLPSPMARLLENHSKEKEAGPWRTQTRRNAVLYQRRTLTCCGSHAVEEPNGKWKKEVRWSVLTCDQ
uniref:Uncharacterized protein n=1 Tax=Myotis myotis TaxID=51298 RepID=A0A7J7RKH6_MYOMY|nr:hypothetical protein mMyoMyo1_010288 [Myotis myotis]